MTTMTTFTVNVRKYLHSPKEKTCENILITADQKDEMLEAFTLFDTDRDGLISTKEIGKVMRALGQTVTVCEETDIVATFAEDKCYEIDFLAFYRLMKKWRKVFDEDNELRESFRTFDKEENGYVTVPELKKLLTTCGEPLKVAEVEDWLRDGQKFTEKDHLYYEDFVTYMLSK